jgi:hypothetical protein
MPQVRFIGLDVHKKKIAVAIAEEGRNGEILSCGSIDNTKAALAKLLQKLGKESATLRLCYEASGTRPSICDSYRISTLRAFADKPMVAKTFGPKGCAGSKGDSSGLRLADNST